MPTKFVGADEFRELARRGTASGVGVRREAPGFKKDGAGNDGTFFCVLSDDSIDLSYDRLLQNWDLAAFGRNSVAPWSHDLSIPPIGRWLDVAVRGTQLTGRLQFPPPGQYDLADTCRRLVELGFLRGVSVGFKPLQWKLTDDKARPGGIDWTRSQLLECSLCAVPCNSASLVLAQAKGVDLGPLRRLERSTPASRVAHARALRLTIGLMDTGCFTEDEAMAVARKKYGA
jgi:hypothetical protein